MTVASGLHADAGVGEIHVPYNWSYADAAARTGAGGFVAGDVGKLARQEDDNTIWILTATTPTWVQIGSNASEVDDTAYDATSWNGVTDKAPSKNAVRDKIETLSANAGALVLLEQHTASNSTELAFTTAITATYDEYLFEILNLVPVTNGVDLNIQMSTDGGSTYDATAKYGFALIVVREAASAGTSSLGSAGSIPLNYPGGYVSNSAYYGASGTMRLFNPGSTALYKAVILDTFSFDGSYRNRLIGQGNYQVATPAVNALRFFFSSGNISSGTVRCYGIAKS